MDVPGFLRDPFGGLRYVYQHRLGTCNSFHHETFLLLKQILLFAMNIYVENERPSSST